jgi:hypothetical protein
MTIRRCILALLAPLMLLAAGCGNADTPAKGSSPMTQPKTIASRPLCVGRFLIDVPADAKVTWTTTNTYEVGEIVTTLARRGEFVHKIEEVEAQLRSRTHLDEGQLLKEMVEPRPDAKVFVFRRDEFSTTGYELAGYVFYKDSGRYFLLKDGANNDRLERAKSRIADGLIRLQPRDTWAIPTDPGFCFDNGFLPGKESGFEATGVQLEFPGFPNLLIALSTRANDRPPPEGGQLLPRSDAVLRGVDGADRPAVLRHVSARQLGDRTGQEVMWKWTKSGSVMLSGNMEVYASSRQLASPEIAFALALDPPKQEGGATAKEADVLQLWDAIIQSLRLRPGAL